MRLTLSILLLIFTQCTTLSLLYAQTPITPNIAYEQKHKIALITSDIPLYLYTNAKLSHDINTGLLRKKILNYLANYPYTTLIPDQELHDSLRKHPPQIAKNIAQAKIELQYAKSHFQNLNFAPSLALLQRAIKIFQQTHIHRIEPQIYAESQQLLAYTLLEMTTTNNPASNIKQINPENQDELPQIDELSEQDLLNMQNARLAFLELIRTAPYIIMQAGRQPPKRVQLYEEARKLFLDNNDVRKTSTEEAQNIADKTNADLLIFMRIVQTSNADLIIEIDFYNKNTKQLKFLSTPIKNIQNEQSLYNSATAMLSKQLACLKPFEPKTKKNKQEHRFYIELAFTQSSLLVKPTDHFFFNYGISTKLTYMITKNFFTLLNIDLTFSTKDSAKDLFTNLIMIRNSIDFGISYNFKYIRPYIATGIEMANTTNFSVTNSVICKGFGTNDPECTKNAIKYYKFPFLLGVNVLSGLNIGLNDFFFVIELNLAAYILPNGITDLNFPFGYKIGLQYRF